jgi:hypothetical protein
MTPGASKMGHCGGYNYRNPEREAARRAVIAHFRARGIPSTRHEELWWRWVRQKGYRPPCL